MTMLIAVSMITEMTIDHCKLGISCGLSIHGIESLSSTCSLLKKTWRIMPLKHLKEGKEKRRETEFSFGSKAQQQQIEWRRDRVLELSSQGFTQSDITTMLQVDKSPIS